MKKPPPQSLLAGAEGGGFPASLRISSLPGATQRGLSNEHEDPRSLCADYGSTHEGLRVRIVLTRLSETSSYYKVRVDTSKCVRIPRWAPIGYQRQRRWLRLVPEITEKILANNQLYRISPWVFRGSEYITIARKSADELGSVYGLPDER